MKLVRLLIILLVISSCSQSRKIEGIWVGYRYPAHMGYATYINEKQDFKLYNYIVKIENDSLKYANLINFHSDGDFSNSISIKNLKLNNLPLQFDTNHFYLNHYKGVIEIKTPGLSNEWVLLTKLSDNYKSKEKCNDTLTGIYRWTTTLDTFYLKIVNDTLFGQASSLNDPYYFYKANFFKYEGLNFFIWICDNNALVYLIASCREDNIMLIRPWDRISKYDSIYLTPVGIRDFE